MLESETTGAKLGLGETKQLVQMLYCLFFELFKLQVAKMTLNWHWRGGWWRGSVTWQRRFATA
jgi:hypothetical protein